MPNHIHQIIIISPDDDVKTPRLGVSTESRNHWKPSALGVIVNQVKGACTRRILSEADPRFAWQARYYDHIIRTKRDLDTLRAYIQQNPLNFHAIPNEAAAHA